MTDVFVYRPPSFAHFVFLCSDKPTTWVNEVEKLSRTRYYLINMTKTSDPSNINKNCLNVRRSMIRYNDSSAIAKSMLV
uniref:Uncharacterized protein n=1 Tax=Heterorhabditis bacteriophora TaxID=37862 RepID=A0A1I7XD24_HETBA